MKFAYWTRIDLRAFKFQKIFWGSVPLDPLDFTIPTYLPPPSIQKKSSYATAFKQWSRNYFSDYLESFWFIFKKVKIPEICIHINDQHTEPNS